MNRNLLYVGIVLILFMVLAWFFSNILLYVVISIVISSILRPLTNYISNTQFFQLRMPRVIAVFTSFTIFIGVLVLFVTLFIPLISEQIKRLPDLLEKQEKVLEESIRRPVDGVEAFISKYGLVKNDQPGFMMESVQQSLQSFVASIDIASLINSIIGFTGSFFVGILAIAFISFFLLYEMGSMRKKIIAIIPNKYFEVSIAAFNKIDRLFSNYLLGLLFQMLFVFSLASLGLWLLGFKYSLTIAVFAAVANLIPYIGPVLGASFGIMVGVSTLPGLEGNEYMFLIVKILSVFAVVQLVDNLVLQPVIFSKSVKAHPLEIFIIIFAGATLGKSISGGAGGGIVGMISAIPVYTIVRVSAIELYTGYRKYSIFKS